MAHGETMKGYMLQLKYKGIFNMDGLLGVIRDWLDNKEYDVHQPRYKTKYRSPMGKEMEVDLFAYRNDDDWIRVAVNVYIHVWDAHEVEVVRNGKKMKAFKGRLYMQFRGDLTIDYNGRYEKTAMGNAIRKFLIGYVQYRKIDTIDADRLHYKIHELHTVVKDYLNMETALNEFADMW